MRVQRLLTATLSFAVSALSVVAQSSSAAASPIGNAGVSRVVGGRVHGPDGAAAIGAVVVSSAGGLATTQQDGTFTLRVCVPGDSESLRVTAVADNDLAVSTQVALRSGAEKTDAGTLVLAATTSCQPSWLPTFGAQPGVGTGPVLAFATFDDGSGPALFVGGHFTSAGAVAANNIARWDGAAWSPLGSGLNNDVGALVAYDDGRGPALYAGGNFTKAGGVAASDIAKWDGASWSPLAGGTNNRVRALAVYDDGITGPALYVGGSFTKANGLSANRIAKWNGTNWSALGQGVLGSPTPGSVNALTVHDDGSGLALYVGGSFVAAGGMAARSIAKWNGSSWFALGSGISGQVNALAVYDDGSGLALFAGGAFGMAGGVAVANLTKWNGTSWSALGSGVGTGAVNALTVFDDGTGSALFAVGALTTAGGVPVSGIARWDGATWSSPGGAASGVVNAIAAYDDGGGRALYTGDSSGGIAKWNGATWSLLAKGLDSEVFALAQYDHGSGPALYAGGTFAAASGGAANAIARWNGATWSPVGGGMDKAVYALTVFNDGAGPALYAGGAFTSAGGVAASHIAKWNGATWSPVGSGTDGDVRAFAVFDDGSGPAVYVAGTFSSAGGVGANNIARWNGATWSPVKTGVGGPFVNGVMALAVYNDGRGAMLYAAGNFTAASGVLASNITKWNGTTWSSLGSGLDGSVSALTVFDAGSGPALYAGGHFATAGGSAASNIAKWNGVTWSPLGSGTNGDLLALTVFDDGSGPALCAGGRFTTAGGVAASYIAQWGCPLPAGVLPYGSSSPGCTGPLAMGATSSPRVGSTSFAITCTNAPASAPGVLLAGTALASPLRILGFELWVSPFLSLNVASGASGVVVLPVAIRADPLLVGLAIDLQLLWLGPTAPPPCPPIGLSASNALELTIQP